MKLFFSVIFCLMIFTMQSLAQDEQQMDPQMKAWMEYMTPGPTHEMIAKDNGTWKAKMTMWTTPDSEPMEAEGDDE
jgi:hypothetical protein